MFTESVHVLRSKNTFLIKKCSVWQRMNVLKYTKIQQIQQKPKFGQNGLQWESPADDCTRLIRWWLDLVAIYDNSSEQSAG